MNPWAFFFFCPACHSVPLWSLSLHTLCPIWAAGFGRKRKRTSHKPQIVSSCQIKHCCLRKKNELKIRAISILVQKKEAPFTRNRESFFLDRAVPTAALSFLYPSHPSFLRTERRIIVWLRKKKVTRQSAKTIFNSRQWCPLLACAWPKFKMKTWKNNLGLKTSVLSIYNKNKWGNPHCSSALGGLSFVIL